MQDNELISVWDESKSENRPRVTVFGRDYRYDGKVISVFTKLGGDVRAVVEDRHGRCFIHNAEQIELSTAMPQ